jgi:hypothetical protein
MLKADITEPLREHYVKYVDVPAIQREASLSPMVLERVLFEEFPRISHPAEESKIPNRLREELQTDLNLAAQRLVSVSKTRKERVILSRQRIEEMEGQLESMEHYFLQLVHWAPGYNSGIDSMRNSLLSSKSRLEQEKYFEHLKCLEDCSRLEQSLLDLVREYERLKTDLDLFSR